MTKRMYGSLAAGIAAIALAATPAAMAQGNGKGNGKGNSAQSKGNGGGGGGNKQSSRPKGNSNKGQTAQNRGNGKLTMEMRLRSAIMAATGMPEIAMLGTIIVGTAMPTAVTAITVTAIL